jgi:DNA mismatch endonuclease (patch repair protein)
MKRQRRRDTAPEVALRSELHRLGLRFRVDAPLPGLRRRADVLFTRSRVAVFLDGCFWHGCPDHGTWPKNNAEWWRRKIEANKERDADTDERLSASGWLVVRAWEHDDPNGVAKAVQAALQMRSPSAPNGGRKPT